MSSQQDFPNIVQVTLRPLAEPLPLWLQNGAYPYHSSISAESLPLLKEELEGVPTPVVNTSDALDVSLKSIFDLILSNSRDMRTTVRGDPCRALSFWITFTSSLLRTISDDIFPRQDASFIKPREDGADSMSVDNLDGRAFLIASHIVVLDSRDKVESCAQVDDSPPAIDLPLEAHIISGQEHRNFAELPVFVIADPETIIPLLSGVLYQRRVWGIPEVAVGLVVSNSSTAGRLVFAWLNELNESEVDLPPVHIAFYEDRNPVLGVFDLANPRDTFMFARFVLSLSSHRDAMIGSLSLDNVGKLPRFRWRSDFAHPALQSANKVPGADFCVDETDSTDKDSPNIGVVDENENENESEDEDEDSISMTMSVSEQKGNTQLSEFVRMSDWLLARHAFILPPLLFDSADDDPDFLSCLRNANEHVDFYNKLTALSWPSQWTSLETLPLADLRVADVRLKLWDAYAQMRSECQFSDIDPSHTDIITWRFSGLLHSIDGASTAARSHAFTSDEAERSHDWDVFLMTFLQTQLAQPDGRLGDILLKRTVNVSRNLLADVPSECEEIGETLDMYTKLLGAAMPDLTSPQTPSPHIMTATEALAGAIFYRYNPNRKDLSETVMTQSNTESLEEICDAVLSSRCHGGIASITSALPAGIDAATFLDHFLFLPNVARNTHNMPNYASPSVPGDNGIGIYEERRGDLELPIEVPIAESQDLLLPILVAHYENRHRGTRPSMDQGHTYLVSALQFLGSLGFANRPVFGLVMHGSLVVVTMGWQTDGKSFILESDMQEYDISEPFQAFQFAIFLVRVADYARHWEVQNKQIIDDAVKNFPSRIYWSKKAQRAGLGRVMSGNA